MSKLSAARKVGVVARVATRQAGKSRIGGALSAAVRTSARSLAKVLHQLWLEVIGAVFLAVALMGAVAAVREYTKFTAGRATMGHVVIAACFTLTFAWFGVSSFWRVKKSGTRQRS